MISEYWNILIFAHKMEAQIFLNKKNWKTRVPNIYTVEDYILIIAGQGCKNVFFMLDRMMHSLPDKIVFGKIVNLGVAGAMSPAISKGQVCAVRSVKRIDRPVSYDSSDKFATFDCLTTDQPIDRENMRLLSNEKFDLVDMELWEIARFAHVLNIPFFSLKYTSDFIWQKLNKNDVRQQAENASLKLWDAYNCMRTEE